MSSPSLPPSSTSSVMQCATAPPVAIHANVRNPQSSPAVTMQQAAAASTATPILSNITIERKKASHAIITTKVHPPVAHSVTNPTSGTLGEKGDSFKVTGLSKKDVGLQLTADHKPQIMPTYAASSASFVATHKHTILPLTSSSNKTTVDTATSQPANSGPPMVPMSHLTQTLIPSPLAGALISHGGHRMPAHHFTTVARGGVGATAHGKSGLAATILRPTLPGQPPSSSESMNPAAAFYMYSHQLQRHPSPVTIHTTLGSSVANKYMVTQTNLPGHQSPSLLQLPGTQATSTDHNRNMSTLSSHPMANASLTYQPVQGINISNVPVSSHPMGSLHATDAPHPSRTPHMQQQVLSQKVDGTHGTICQPHLQQVQGQLKQEGSNVQPTKVELRMVIRSENTADGKRESANLEQRLITSDNKSGDVRIDIRPEVKGGLNTTDIKTSALLHVVPAKGSKSILLDHKKGEHHDNKKIITKHLDSKEHNLKPDIKRVEIVKESKGDLRGVYRPEMKMPLKGEMKHEPTPTGYRQDPQHPQWNPSYTTVTTRHSVMTPNPTIQRQRISMVHSKPHVLTHSVTSAVTTVTGHTPTVVAGVTAVLVSASSSQPLRTQVPISSTIPVSTNISSSTSIPIAKVYPRQQQHPTNTRVPGVNATSHVDTSSSSYQPVNRGPMAVTTLSGVTSTNITDSRQDRPAPALLTSSGFQAHRYGGYEYLNYHAVLPPYHHPFHAPSLRGVGDTNARYPFSTVTVPGTHTHTGGGGPVQHYPLMMINRATMGLNVGGLPPADVQCPEGVLGSPLPATGDNVSCGASPRPSILRKRGSENSTLRKHPISALSNSQPGSPAMKLDSKQPIASASPKPSDSLPSSQHSVESNASETSTDTAPSSAGSVKIKTDPESVGNDIHQSSHLNDLAAAVPIIPLTEEGTPSPRKKPRKQTHKVATDHPEIMNDQSTDDEVEKKPRVPYKVIKKERKERRGNKHASENMKVVQYVKRTCPRLMDAYRSTCNWKPALNHFERYCDVKQKDEKKTNIHEIANQRGIVKKTEGWKIKHITYQFEDLCALEKEVCSEIEEMKAELHDNVSEEDKDMERVYELVQGTLQRSKYIIDNLGEARSTVMKLLDHKPKVAGILKKHANKRHAKKKHTNP